MAARSSLRPQSIGSSDTQVNWRATYGSINSSGLYTASATQSPDTVDASTSNSNGSTTVQILGLKPVITSISPQPATAGDQLTITGQNLNSILTAKFPDAIGGTIPISAIANGRSATVAVPQGSVTGAFVCDCGARWAFSDVEQYRAIPAPCTTPYPRSAERCGCGRISGFPVCVTWRFGTADEVAFSADQGTFSGSTYFARPRVLRLIHLCTLSRVSHGN